MIIISVLQFYKFSVSFYFRYFRWSMVFPKLDEKDTLIRKIH